MARKSLRFRLNGVTPLLVHNAARLANPCDDLAKELKRVSSKRKKTDSDFEEMARIEFIGSLYVNGEGEPVIPGTNLRAMLCEGAKAVKLGKLFKENIQIPFNSKIIYEGPGHYEQLWGDKRFIHAALVRVGTSKVMRTRPQFPVWSLETEVFFDDDNVRGDQILEVLRDCGRRGMLGDWRGTFGHFEASMTE